MFFDEDDIESNVVIRIFKSTDFNYNPMSGKPDNFNYVMLKDVIKWNGLQPKLYVNILNAMFKNFKRHLPSK